MSAVTLLREAADELRWQAPGAAADLLREGVRLLPADRAGSTDHWDLQMRLARCLAVAGRLHHARYAAHQLLHQLPGDERQRPTAVALAAMIERLLGHHPQARALLLHELDTLQDAATATSLKLELGLGALLAGDFSVDRLMIGEAYRTAHDLDHQPLRAHSAALVALADYTAGAITAAQSGAGYAAAVVDALPDQTLATSLEATAYLGWTEMFLERFHPALRHFERGLRLARQTGQEHLFPYLLCGVACDYYWLGQLDTAAQRADDAVAAAELSGSDELRTMAYAMQAFIACRKGDVDLGAAGRRTGGHRSRYHPRLVVRDGRRHLRGGPHARRRRSDRMRTRDRGCRWRSWVWRR